MSDVVSVTSIRRQPAQHYLNGRELHWLLDEYLSTCRQRVHSQATVDGYAYKLRWFRRWWAAAGPERNWLLSEADLGAFELWLRTAVSARTHDLLSYHTRNDVMRRLRECLLWAYNHGYTEHNYASWVPRVDGGPELRRAAPAQLLWRLMEAAMLSNQPMRDRTILAIFIGTGLRRGEVANLNVEDIVVEADHSGYALVRGKRTKARPTGERLVAFDETTGRYLVAYLDNCRHQQGPLFRGRNDERLSAITIYRVVKRAVAKAGLEDYVQGPHDLRRAFATYWLRMKRGEGSADLLRRQLGHAHYGMTSQYTLADVDDIRAELVSPLAHRSSIE